MKKTFKRAGIAVLSMSMLLSMGAMTALSVGAVTDDAQTITAPAVNSTYGTGDATYKFYKVLSATANGDHYNYAVTSNFSSYTSVSAIQAVSGGTAVEKQTLAEGLKEHLPTSADYTITATKTAAGTENIAPGYYLVIMNPTGTQMTAAPILLNVKSDMTDTDKILNAKTSGVTFDKKITGGCNSISTDHHKAETAVGSEVEYTITSTIPAYSDKVVAAVKAEPATIDLTDYKIKDTPSTGITIIDGDNKATVNGVKDSSARANSIVVSTNGTAFASGDYTLDTTSVDAGAGFIVTLDDKYVVNNPGKTITITFKGVLNDNASQSTDAATDSTNNHNAGQLVYDNKYDTGTGTGELDKDTEVYTAKFNFTKTFGGAASTLKLPNAQFTLHAGTATGATVGTFTTTSTANVHEFTGLAAGTYVLVEDHAPDGYAKADNVTITIAADLTKNDVYKITPNSGDISMDNTQGQTLPGTGGMGTVLFTVGGAAVVLLAGVLFVVYMRKRKVEE